jgi:hypothetical protein
VGALSGRILATFSGAAYNVTEAPRFGVQDVFVFDDLWLTGTELFQRKDFQYLFTTPGVGNPNCRRGFGWFSWKPFVIQEALRRCEPGDIVLYTDADTYPIYDLSAIYGECERIGGIMLFSAVGCNHANWCKRDCFIQMGMDEPEWRNRQHAVARFMLFKAGAPGVESFLDEWLRYCLDPLATTFEPSVLAPEHPELREHRTEQAILTNLAHKYGHRLYREACQFGANQPEDQDLYPQLFFQDGRTDGQSLQGSAHFQVSGVSR